MSFGTYRQSTEIKRLTGDLEQRGWRIGLSTFSLVLVSCFMTCLGTIIVLIATDTITVDPSTIHVPRFVFGQLGAVVAIAGVMVWGKAWKQFAWIRRCKRGAPERVFTDYPWDQRMFLPSRSKQFAVAVGGAVFLTMFFAPFNFMLDQLPWVIRIFIGGFDAFLLYIYWRALLAAGRALKFGSSRIEFSQFPYRTNGPVKIIWYAPARLGQATGGSFTLRCVKEWFEERGSGEDSTTRLIQEEQWSGSWFLDTPEEFAAGKEGTEFDYEPPAHLPATRLSALESNSGTEINIKVPGFETHKMIGESAIEEVVFWEFEVKLQVSGLDFKQKYLVPVYEPVGTEREENANA